MPAILLSKLTYMNTLSVNHLSLTYKNGFQAIKDISLEIGNGMFGLLGPNGAGKSSLMKTIVGLQNQLPGVLFSTELMYLKIRTTSNKTSVSCLRILVFILKYRLMIFWNT